MILSIIMSMVEVAILILFMYIIVKLHMDEKKSINNEKEENTDKVIYIEDYRREAKDINEYSEESK